MKAIILVGGEGTRLRPLTCNIPKPMIPVANRAFLEHFLEYLKTHGIRDVILSMGYRSDIIERHFGDGAAFGVNLTYVVESSPLGTAGGIKNVESHIDGTCFVFNADIMTDLDLGSMLRAHRQRKAVVTIALTPVEDPTGYGLVETDADGRVLRFIEKPSRDRITTNLINAGTYILEKEVLRLVPPDTHYMVERGLFPTLLEAGEPVYGFASQGYWIDIGTPDTYMSVHRDLLTSRIARTLPGTLLREGVWIGEACSIDATAKIVSPVFLGSDVSVEANATIIGPATIGDGCRIARQAVVQDAVIWHGTSVGVKDILNNCVVANDCNIGDGVSITGGAIIADHCSIGAGNKLDQRIKVWPGKTIEENSISF